MPKPTLDVKVVDDQVRIGDRFTVTFHRTLRIPDDGSTYPLPPSLGSFPVARVSDHRESVPESWREHGGVFIPMYQREAMWLSFGGAHHKPNAVKVGVGKVDALTGEPFDMELVPGGRDGEGQNYLVAPSPQPWLDGINSGNGSIRQFCAMPLGMGYTVEGQVTGEERFGGIQLVCFEPEAGRFPDRPASGGRRRASSPLAGGDFEVAFAASASAGAEMGLGAGGQMDQKIYPDPHGIDVWDAERFGRVYIHIVNSTMWQEITGTPAPASPISAATYTEYGYPWFMLYDETAGDIAPSDTLTGVKSIKEMDAEKGFAPQQDDSTVHVPGGQVAGSPGAPHDPHTVVDGNW